MLQTSKEVYPQSSLNEFINHLTHPPTDNSEPPDPSTEFCMEPGSWWSGLPPIIQCSSADLSILWHTSSIRQIHCSYHSYKINHSWGLSSHQLNQSHLFSTSFGGGGGPLDGSGVSSHDYPTHSCPCEGGEVRAVWPCWEAMAIGWCTDRRCAPPDRISGAK